MATTVPSIAEHDYVELQSTVAGWQAGTRGTVVVASDHHAVVEIAGEGGVALALIDAPYSALRVLQRR
jgi:hypothetical protein